MIQILPDDKDFNECVISCDKEECRSAFSVSKSTAITDEYLKDSLNFAASMRGWAVLNDKQFCHDHRNEK